jgi:hypothetical protein
MNKVLSTKSPVTWMGREITPGQLGLINHGGSPKILTRPGRYPPFPLRNWWARTWCGTKGRKQTVSHVTCWSDRCGPSFGYCHHFSRIDRPSSIPKSGCCCFRSSEPNFRYPKFRIRCIRYRGHVRRPFDRRPDPPSWGS